MGNIEKIYVQRQLSSPKQIKTSLSLQNYSQHTTLSNGHTIVKLENGQHGLFFLKELTSYKQKQIVNKWIKTSFQYCCNILQFSEEATSFVCSANIQFRSIVEYGSWSLAKILEEKREKTSSDPSEQRILSFLDEKKDDSSSVKHLHFVKFLIEVVQEIFLYNKEWISFHTTNLIYFEKEKNYKFLYLPQFEASIERQTFFDPEKILQSKNSQQNTVFSIGMVLMSLLLNEDCSDCYNYRRFSFCRSVFEEKKERTKAIVNSFNHTQCFLNDNNLICDEELATLTLLALSDSYLRPSFSEFKQIYFRILRKISTNCNFDTALSAKSRKSFINSNLRSSNLIKSTIPRRLGQAKDENIHNEGKIDGLNNISIIEKIKDQQDCHKNTKNVQRKGLTRGILTDNINENNIN